MAIRIKIPSKKMIKLNTYNYACNLCGRSGYTRVTLDDKVVVCKRCIEAALSLFGED